MALLTMALLATAPAVVAVEARAHPPLALPFPLAALATPTALAAAPADLDPRVRLDVATAAVARRIHLDVADAVALLRGAVVVVARRLDGVVQLHRYGSLHRDGRRGLGAPWRGVSAAILAMGCACYGLCLSWAVLVMGDGLMVSVTLRAMEWSSSGSRSLPPYAPSL